MYYQIYWQGGHLPHNVLFDIEMYISEDTANKGDDYRWFVEIHSDSFADAATAFVLNRRYGEINWDEFMSDCHDLQELRGWLWETHDNHCRPFNEAYEDLNKWHKVIDNKINVFVNKYGLYLNTD